MRYVLVFFLKDVYNLISIKHRADIARRKKLAETIWKGVFVLVGQEGSLWIWRGKEVPGR
jgi:hypothetical protein